MLLELAQWLAKDIRAFNVFGYITLRAVLACLTALVITFLIGPALIRRLTAYKVGQAVRDDGPQSHLAKAGTPTMGGALILASITLTVLLWADLENRLVWLVLWVMLAFGAIGWVDDYRKVVARNPKGLSARMKFFWQSVIGVAAACFLAFYTNLPQQTAFIVPFFKQVAYPLGALGFIVMTYFVIVGTSNAVNLTDGLDGLAIMPTVMIGGALGIFAYVASLHGRRRRARARRRARHDRRHRAAGDRALHHGRSVRGGDALGDAAGRLLQADGQARLPHGAAPPPLRAEGVEGKPGRGPLLDHHDDARFGRIVHAQVEVTGYERSGLRVGFGEG